MSNIRHTIRKVSGDIPEKEFTISKTSTVIPEISVQDSMSYENAVREHRKEITKL